MLNKSFVLALKLEKYISELPREWTKEEEELVKLARIIINKEK